MKILFKALFSLKSIVIRHRELMKSEMQITIKKKYNQINKNVPPSLILMDSLFSLSF